MPDLDTAKERIKELEQQLDEAIKKLEEQEEKQKQSYLQMFNLTHKQEEKLSESQEVCKIVSEILVL